MLKWSAAAATCLLLGAGVKGAVVAASEAGEVGPAGQLVVLHDKMRNSLLVGCRSV